MTVHPADVRRFALSLPEAVESPHFAMASFRVRGRIFATLPPGDALLHVFVDEPRREAALALHGDFVEKLFWGEKACGLKVRLADARSEVVEHLVRNAWLEKARSRRS